ncbi:MAG: hypothetical protein K0R38_6638 [Polyangiaceae bacterium]|nr:hypothetical protein [Polyangiaceae bacterium]
MRTSNWGWLLAGSLVLGSSLVVSSASACGGFFCSQSQGVNQAAERIVFANNGDGTVTAVIEIQYQGPSDQFSWLLPISSVPMGDQIGVASGLSFQRLQQATNPQYSLQTRVEGQCDTNIGLSPGSGGTASSAGGGSAAGGDSAEGGVTVEASGVVGSFEWAVISLDESLEAPADAAVQWLNENEYDVPPGAPGLLGPYLADGMYLLALRLVKGADAGSIRPIVLTYEATKPMIPIKLTAVAANEDMGVLTWVLGASQAVPVNYNALELNEARINWFSPNAGYNDVVIAAANEAGGQGFVTEYAQASQSLAGVTWSTFEQEDWEGFKAAAGRVSAQDLVLNAMFRYSQWDGFWDVVRKHVKLPATVTLEDVQECPDCYVDEYVVEPSFMVALEADVIEPAQVVQKLLDAQAHVTRLYSTLSAAEMTVDPLFSFNPSLPSVSNLHVAQRIIECAPGYYQQEAPWRIELPQGGVVRGGPQDVGQWPASFDALPANRRILRQGETGAGKVLEDHGATIDTAITAYSSSVTDPPRRPAAGDNGADDAGAGASAGSGEKPGRTDSSGLAAGGGGGCSVGGASPTSGLLLALIGLSALVRRKRRG